MCQFHDAELGASGDVQEDALATYLPFYWSTISNRWTSSSSRIYLKHFGIGVVEWRVLVTLASRLTATSLDAARLSATDPAAANRAMNILLQKSLVVPVEGRHRGRSKPFRLTPSGRSLFSRVREFADGRVALLLQDLDSSERAVLLDLLRRIHGRLDVLTDD